MIHYGTTNTAQLAISRGLAVLTKGTGVTVNSVLPGLTRSEGIIDFLKNVASDPSLPPEEMEAEFYIGHFAGKDDLITQAVATVLADERGAGSRSRQSV